MPALNRVVTAGESTRQSEDPAMSTFDTPEPISVSVELGVGNLRVTASERRDTVVEVRPSDPGKKSDLAAAEQTLVELAGGTLVVRAPGRWTARYAPWGSRESVDVEIALPAGSQLRVDSVMSAVRCAGRLGECHIKTGAGEILVDVAGPLELRTGAGAITVNRAMGQVEVRTGTGEVRVGAIDGHAVVKNSCGDTWIGEVAGGLQVNASFGKISVDRAEAEVAAKTAYGDVRLGDVARGAIVAQTGFGKVEVGIRTGVPAWLDLQAQYGNVHNELESTGPPRPGEGTVEVRSRSSFGDVTVHRS